MMGPRGAGRARCALVPLVACVYSAAIVYLAWPVSADPSARLVDLVASGAPLGHWTEADRNLAIWVLSWTARAAFDGQREFFQANIFHPAPDTLASSENLLGLLPVSGPTFLLTGNPVLTHNLTLFAVILTLAVLTFVLVRDWTGSASAGFLAGAVLGFAPVVVATWSNVISASAVHFFPLVLLLAIRAARRPRWWALVGLSLIVALQVLAGLYVAYQLMVLVALFAPAVWWEARRSGNRPLPILAALGAGFLVLLPLSRPYLRVRATGVLPDFTTARAIASALGLSWEATWQRLVENVGWPVLVLALLGAVTLRRSTWHLRLGLLAAGGVGALLCLGPDASLLPGTKLPGIYEIAMRVVPGFSSMRAPSRFMILPVLSAAVLAGLGAADVLRGLRRFSPGTALAGSLLVVVAGGGMIAMRTPQRPLVAVEMPATPDAWEPYRWLREHGDGRPILELPVMVTPLDLPALRATGGYLIGSALHDWPLINGYTGHSPPTAQLLLSLAQRLPEAGAYEQLCALVDIGWIVVHPDAEPASAESWSSAERRLGLERVAEFPGGQRIYRVGRTCGGLQDRLLAQIGGAAPERTLGGSLLSELAPADRAGRIAIEPANLPARQHAWLWVEVANQGGRTWPGLTVRVPGSVEVQSRFRDPATGRVYQPAAAIPLGVDLEPGDSTRLRVAVQVPPPGDYVLEIGLMQAGSPWFADLPGGGAIARLPIAVSRSAAGGPTKPHR